MADNVIFKMGNINDKAPSYQKGQILFSIENSDLGYIYFDNGNTINDRIKISAYKAENDLDGKSITSYMAFLEGETNENCYIIGGYDAHSDLINDEIKIPGATEEQAGLITTGSQTFAGNKTLIGTLTIKNSTYSPNIGFYPSETSGILGKIYYATSANDSGHLDNARFQFRQYSYIPDSKEVLGFYEKYVLPAVTPGLNNNPPAYEIFTSKDYTTLDDRYVNVTGDTMTGDLKFTNKGIHFVPGDTNQYLWKVYGSTDGSYGFRLQYNGAETGNNNSLSLFADNQQGTEVNAATMLQDGSITLAETLTISKTTDAAGTTNNKPALIVGGTATTAHLELDSNELMAKTNGTSVAALYLNSDGGLVHIGAGGLQVDSGDIHATGTSGSTTSRSVKVTNANGSVGIYTSTDQGLYDFSKGEWIIHRNKGTSTTLVPAWGTKGSSSLPVYFSGGQPIACNSTLDVSITGNAATATAFSSSRTIALTGAVSGSVSGNGSSGWSIATTIAGKTITPTNFTTTFRTQTKGDANAGTYFSVIRSNTTDSWGHMPQWSSGIAFGQSDTHGYLYINYSSAAAYIGGGSADKLNWTKNIAFGDGTGASGTWGINITGSSASCTGNAATATKATKDGSGNTITSTYLKLAGGTMTGLLSAHGGISLNNSTPNETPSYILGIRAFVDGGNIIWQTASSVSVGYATSAGSANSVAWGNVTGKPSAFAPSSHTHSYLPLSGGNVTGAISITTSGVTNSFYSQNSSYTHYSTNASVGHWFNKAVYVQGEIYAGSSYNKRVYHMGNIVYGSEPTNPVDRMIWLYPV